jgi:hypothetical protein
MLKAAPSGVAPSRLAAARAKETKMTDTTTTPPAETTPPADASAPPAPVLSEFSTITMDVSGVPATAVVGEPYHGLVTTTGGGGGVVFSIHSGKLPDGLSMAAGGLITGTPVEAGDYDCEVAGSDLNRQYTEMALPTISVTVKPPETEPPPVDTTPPPPTLSLSPNAVTAAVGVASEVPVAASGGVAPYSLASGAPTGVAYDGTNVSFDTTTTAFSGNVTVQDSSSPPLTGDLAVTIA